MNEKFAELLGIMEGDGCLSRCSNSYLIYISGHKIDDMDYHKRITKNLFKDIFDKQIKINLKKGEQTLFIRFADKEIFKELAKYIPVGRKYNQLKIPDEIIKAKSCFFAFIRGLVDTDGCIVLSKQHRDYPYYPRIEISSISKPFLQSILLELNKYGFYGSISYKGGRSYRLEIPGIKNLIKWLDYIGFSNRKHMKKIEKLPNGSL